MSKYIETIKLIADLHPVDRDRICYAIQKRFLGNVDSRFCPRTPCSDYMFNGATITVNKIKVVLNNEIRR
jgi:hypothetical protein